MSSLIEIEVSLEPQWLICIGAVSTSTFRLQLKTKSISQPTNQASAWSVGMIEEDDCKEK